MHRLKVPFIHCIKQLSVRRFKSVNLRNSTGKNNAHCVRHIVFSDCRVNVLFYNFTRTVDNTVCFSRCGRLCSSSFAINSHLPLAYIKIVNVLVTMSHNVIFSALKIVTEQNIKNFRCFSASVGITFISLRVSGFIVVRFIISGSFSPRPFER